MSRPRPPAGKTRMMLLWLSDVGTYTWQYPIWRRPFHIAEIIPAWDMYKKANVAF